MSNWALITGAGKRIGRAIALELAEAGWDIIIHYNRSAEAAKSLAQAIEEREGYACLVEMDLANAGAVAKLIPSLVAELGPLGALVNNAAIFEPDEQDADGQRHHAINLEVPKLLSDAFHAMRDPAAEVPPVIVNLLDADPFTGFKAYRRSKLELERQTIELAKRFAPAVRVNGVALGPVWQGERETSQHFDELIAATPLKRQVAAAEVAAAVRFLIETPSITGTVLPVDSGVHWQADKSA